MKLAGLALFLAVIGACALAVPSVAGVIQGRVLVPPVPPPVKQARSAYVGSAAALAQPRTPERGAPRDAVVYIETIPASVDSTLPAWTGATRLAQQDQSFVPRVVVVPAGGFVDFPNLDPIYHSVFSVSPIKRFDLGRYGHGKSKRVKFTKPGLVNVYCDIHANMEGFIFVTPNRAAARPDEEGRYALPDLPPGRYALTVWHPDLPSIHRDVTVPERGGVSLDLTLVP